MIFNFFFLFWQAGWGGGWSRKSKPHILTRHQSAAMVLALALVDAEKDMEPYHKTKGHILPSFPFHIAQQIQTRCDFIRRLDSLNMFAITSTSHVRASSVPMHHAFREICATEGFRDLLEATLDRISAIESLGRTRELVAKDLVLGGRYEIKRMNKGHGVEVTLVSGEKDDGADSGNDGPGGGDGDSDN
jgi:hypothetical protein